MHSHALPRCRFAPQDRLVHACQQIAVCRAHRGWRVRQCSHARPEPGQRRLTASVSAQASDVKPGLFPAGKQQAKLQLPVIFITMNARDAADESFLKDLESAVQAGVSGLLLRDDASGGGDLFEAATQLKTFLRGRAILLVEDRADIASAAQTDGVLLTSKGVPTVVARRILSDTSYLVGRAANPEEAATTAADGANFILLQSKPDGGELTPAELEAVNSGQRSGLRIPVVLDVASIEQEHVSGLLAAGLDGVCGDVERLRGFAECAPGTWRPSTLGDVVTSVAASILDKGCVVPPPEEVAAAISTSNGMLSKLLNSQRETLLAKEKEVMAEIIGFLEEASPEMDETRLLRDAVAALDDAFLVVVVGEFNSGKSSVVNALLGERFLEEGILPTTNEISILKYADNGTPATSKTEDGLFVRTLPAELLSKLNIVDTPGTNVILERQQRLTEEFVPRADLVLFIMSADRPCTDSEVKFLRYIRQWGKKVVFVLNKVDIFESADDVEQVVQFVNDNAKRLLGVSSASVIPVSARLALQAKLAAGSATKGGVLTSVDIAGPLSADPAWQSSRFMSLESFMLDFLTGTHTAAGADAGAAESAGGESVRLKLQTPVFVAQALLQAAQRQLEAEMDVALREVAAIEAVEVQVAKFRREMAKDGTAQRALLRKQLQDASKRAERAVNDLLQLSNLSVLSSYVFADKSQRRETMPLAQALESSLEKSDLSEVPERLREHTTWLQANTSNQLQSYIAFVQQRGGEAPSSVGALATSSSDSAEDVTQQGGMVVLAGDVEPRAMALALEGEVRDAVLGTASSAGGAAAFGTVLTVILPTTLEDLMAVALAGSAAYMALLNLPIRRGEIKASVQARYEALASRIEKEMMSELEEGLEQFETAVRAMVKPLEYQARSEVQSIEELQSRLEDLKERLAEIKMETAKI